MGNMMNNFVHYGRTCNKKNNWGEFGNIIG
jgi:hypothetical protein